MADSSWNTPYISCKVLFIVTYDYICAVYIFHLDAQMFFKKSK